MDTTELQLTTDEVMGARLDRLQQIALGVGAAGLLLSIVGFVLDQSGFFHSYLYAFLFWWGVTTGSLGLLLLHHVVGGGWSFLIRRYLEAGTRLLPWVLVMFLPVIVGLLNFGLYSWNPHGPVEDPLEAHKYERYLNVPFFVVRAAIYFLIWWLYARYLNRWGATQDERNDIEVSSRLNRVSARGLVVFCLTVTFAAVDWIMSLTPNWYSSIFGMLVIVSQGLSTLALMIFLTGFLVGEQPLRLGVPSGYFRDLGNLTLAFVMLWAYMSFSQYIITYSGNTAEEITWYVVRRNGGWGVISLSLIAMHFFLPFGVLLVASGIKRNPLRLAKVMAFIILMRFIDLFWWVTPTFRKSLGVSVADLGTPLLLGGIWLWLWAGQMRGRPVVPVHDPRLEGNFQEVVEHG
jgi:hypothetical protein